MKEGSELRARVGPEWADAAEIGKYVDADTKERFAKAEVALKRALELNPDLSAAERAYAHLEVDLGRAEESMVRLLRRARGRAADPELFAGLSHSLRYCGLLQASVRPRHRPAGSTRNPHHRDTRISCSAITSASSSTSRKTATAEPPLLSLAVRRSARVARTRTTSLHRGWRPSDGLTTHQQELADIAGAPSPDAHHDSE